MAKVKRREIKLATLERDCVTLYEREREELREATDFLKARINRAEGEQLAGMSIDEAAVAVIRAHGGRSLSYFELFDALKVTVLSPEENPVSLYHKLRRSEALTMTGGTRFNLRDWPRARS